MKTSLMMSLISLFALLFLASYIGFHYGNKNGLSQCYPYAVPYDVAIHREGN